MTTENRPDELPIEAQEWSKPITEEWGKIYSRFLEDTRAMIKRGGGPDKVKVESYGSGSFGELVLSLNYWGQPITTPPSSSQAPEAVTEVA